MDSSAFLSRSFLEFGSGLSAFCDDYETGLSVLLLPGRRVSVFGGTDTSRDSPPYSSAFSFGKKAGALGVSIMTGGGRGIMEAANKGAFVSGASSFGLLVSCIAGEETNEFVTHRKVFHTLSVRLLTLICACDAVVFFPGGYGTIEEFACLAIRLKLGLMKTKPVFLFGREFWSGLFTWLSGSVLGHGLIKKEDLSLFSIEDDIDRMIDSLYHLNKA
jgi:uncharacterized protein (TIGR00730 family)